MTKTQRKESILEVLDVLADGNRIDRVLTRDIRGKLYTTTPDESDRSPSLTIPVSYEGTDDDENAAYLVDNFDALAAGETPT